MAMNLGNMKNMLSQKRNSFSNIIIQIVAGVIIVYAIYLISLVAVKADKLGIDSKFDTNKKQKVVIIDGYADSSVYAGNFGTINTAVPTLYNYVPVRPSVNLKGGAQFTYSIWLYVRSSGENYANKCIFLKGDKRKYDYTLQDTKGQIKNINDRIAFCPMFCFGNNPMEFKVYFNTIHKIKEMMEVRKLSADNTVFRRNLLNLFNDKWVMITITFEDNIPINDFENGLMVKFYVNDTLYQTNRYNSTLKQNNGSLYMFPDGTIDSCRLSNFVYYNYAASDKEIRDMANFGPSTKPVEMVTKSFISPMMLSDYNRLDIYNT